MKINLRVTVFPRLVGYDHSTADFKEQCKLATKIKTKILKHLDGSDYDGVVIQFDEIETVEIETVEERSDEHVSRNDENLRS